MSPIFAGDINARAAFVALVRSFRRCPVCAAGKGDRHDSDCPVTELANSLDDIDEEMQRLRTNAEVAEREWRECSLRRTGFGEFRGGR